jgi:hypothetical protein
MKKHLLSLLMNLILTTIEHYGGHNPMDDRALDLQEALERYMKDAFK